VEGHEHQVDEEAVDGEERVDVDEAAADAAAEDVAEDMDPFADQVAVAEDPENLMTQLFSAGNDLDSVRAKGVASTFRDLLKLGFVAPHFSMMVEGKPVATMTQLLQYQGVSAAALEAELQLDLNNLAKLGLSSKEFVALGYKVFVDGEDQPAAAPEDASYKKRYQVPGWLQGEDAAAPAAAAAAAAAADPQIEALIKSSFDQRKAKISFNAPVAQPNVELVECHECGGDDCDHEDHYAEGEAEVEVGDDDEVVPYEEDDEEVYEEPSAPILMIRQFSAGRVTAVAEQPQQPQRSDQEIREQYNRQHARGLSSASSISSAAISAPMPKTKFLAAMAAVKLH